MFTETSIFKGKDLKALNMLAHAAERLERYEDLRSIIEQILKVTKEDPVTLTSDQREFYASANKQLLESYRSVIHNFSSIMPAMENHSTSILLGRYFVRKILEVCLRVYNTLEVLVKASEDLVKSHNSLSSAEALVFYYKMFADYLRYEVEARNFLLDGYKICTKILEDPSDRKEGDVAFVKKLKELIENLFKKENSADLEAMQMFVTELVEKSNEYYDKGITVAKEKLPVIASTTLGVVLNYSVFLYEIRDQKKEAIALADEYHNKALEMLPNIEDTDEYNKANVVVMLLKENVEGWKNELDYPERKSANY